MAEHLTLVNLRRAVSARAGVSEKVADDFLNALFDSIQQGLQKDGKVSINGLGTFALQDVPARESVNVATGERITIKGYKKVVFSEGAQRGKKQDEAIDPIEKLGEQAEEIKGILSELDAMSTEESVQESTETTDQTDAVVQESTDHTDQTEVVEVVVSEAPHEQPIEEKPAQEQPKGEEKKPFNAWLTGLITIGIFAMLLVIAYFVLRHQIVSWAEGMRNGIEQRVSSEPTEPEALVIEVPEENEPAEVAPEAPAETAEVSEPAEPVKAAQPKAKRVIKSRKFPTNYKPTPAAELARYYDDNERFFDEIITTETVGKDSRLAWVAWKHYGEKAMWVFVYEANRDRVKDPNFVKPGVKLRIPKLPPELRDLSKPETQELVERLSEKYLR